MKTLSLDLPLKNLSNHNKITYKEKRRSVFFLHGYGSNKEDLYPICNYFSKDWVCISLEATIPVNNNGWAWAELNYDNIEKLPKPDQMKTHLAKVTESIDKSVELLNLDPKKINLLGFSLGAALSILCGLSNPKKYRAIVALCGFIPVEETKYHLGEKVISDFNLFIGNGRMDPIIPLDLARSTRDGLINMGVHPDYKEYNSEHTINQECLNDFINWLEKYNTL